MELEQEHPIPQQISSYSFRLVGDMTLKQFFQVAAGVVTALLVYATPLPPIVKWPVIALFVLLGIGFAFFTIEDRPLETWVVIFFKAIYTPTEFIWKKTDKEPVYYQQPAPTVASAVASPQIQSPVDQSQKANLQPNLERNEKTILENIGNIFSLHHSPGLPMQSPTPTAKPNVNISAPVPTIPKVEKQIIPEVKQASQVESATSTVEQTLVDSKQIEGIEAQFSPDAAPPSPPTVPNTIVGQVMDSDKKIVEGAILEVKDSQGRPVRALKSNKVGHFMIVTPLADGEYDILIEKENLNFEPVNIKAEGKVIPPIAIRAKNKKP